MKKFELKKIDSRKLVGTLIGGVFFIYCILFFTYAYYEWKSTNTNVVLGIQDLNTECVTGEDVNATNIGPVLDYNDGVKATFSIENGTSSAESISLSLDITSISDNLKIDSFKWILRRDTAGGTNYSTLLQGDFSEMVVGSNVISSDLSVGASATYSYQFIVYIDGSVYNNPNMQENSLISSLSLGNCAGGGSGTGDSEEPELMLLSEVEIGSYVAYVGNNGCEGMACSGQNANYVDDTNMGYCANSRYKFNVNGWRVAYIENGSAHLISAGAVECMCTTADGTISYDSCPSLASGYDREVHVDNLNSIALKYCDSDNERCEGAWAMNAEDFKKITGSNFETCFTGSCLLKNDLIDIGGYYWYASFADSTVEFYYDPCYVNGDLSLINFMAYGVRPVIKMFSGVSVTGGTGTYADPYTVSSVGD